jgi:hypothetical protein
LPFTCATTAAAELGSFATLDSCSLAMGNAEPGGICCDSAGAHSDVVRSLPVSGGDA